MSKRIWFVTVDVPGGEYAVQAETAEKAWRIIMAHIPKFHSERQEWGIETQKGICTRPAPPELVEWLEHSHPEGTQPHADSFHYHVPGGWARVDIGREDAISSCVIPVALASGITVIEENK